MCVTWRPFAAGGIAAEFWRWSGGRPAPSRRRPGRGGEGTVERTPPAWRRETHSGEIFIIAVVAAAALNARQPGYQTFGPAQKKCLHQMRPTELVWLVHVAKSSMKKATSDVNYELLRIYFLKYCNSAPKDDSFLNTLQVGFWKLQAEKFLSLTSQMPP